MVPDAFWDPATFNAPVSTSSLEAASTPSMQQDRMHPLPRAVTGAVAVQEHVRFQGHPDDESIDEDECDTDSSDERMRVA